VKVSGSLMNMVLVIISALVTNVAAYAQLSTELEQTYSVTSQQVVKPTANVEQLSALTLAKVQKIFCNDDFKIFSCNERAICRVDYQTKLIVKFKTAKNIFVNINNTTSLLPPFISKNSDETPS